jgi:hypothetical protein
VLTLDKMTDPMPVASELRPQQIAVDAAQAHADVLGGATRFREQAPTGSSEFAAAYLWLDAGQSWPFLRRFETISNRALCGWLFVVAACCVWAMTTMMTDGTRPIEATLQMERLAEKLESKAEIPVATASAVARMLGQPWYDCRHVACSAELADRNRLARTRLETLLASRGPSIAPDGNAGNSRRAAVEVAR